MADQPDWRFCRNCSELFFNGFPDNKGKSPRTGGGHEAAGFNFFIPFNVGESPHGQGGWRNCMKCQAMFFDGFPDNKGKCPSGGGHEVFPGSFAFVIPHSLPETVNEQTNWRNCMKCQALFFDGFADKGTCPAGGGHELFPGSLHFRLAHPIHPSAQLHDEGFQVRVGGASYTPDERVEIMWRYNTEFGQTSSGVPLVATTNTDGFFADALFDLQPGAKFIAVRATDTRTGQFAESFLRGGA